MIGQDAVATALSFDDGVGFTGVVLTKLDGDARGGAALSVRQVTGRPILFASNGEKLADFDVFHPDRMASKSASFSPDRKSTRLNSSHMSISYAVFCLKKKKKVNKTC